MLVLTRKSNQSIMIGDDIEVSVLSIMGEKVRIGIQAPRDIPVFRREVYLEIQQENAAAGASARAEVDDALKGFLDGSLSREDAASKIADNYLRFVKVYDDAEASARV